MGGFLYFRKAPGVQLPAQAPSIDGDGFALFVSQKRFVKGEQVVRLPGGDFVAAVGTLFYKTKMGEPALRALYDEFGGPSDLFSDLCGSFAVVLRKNGVVSCFNDYFGNYHIYSDSQANVVSSSFLAVLQTLKQVEPSPQALYEYVFDAAIYGSETLVRGIHRLEPSRIHQLCPRGPSVQKTCRLAQSELPARFDDQVDAANAELVSYFEMLRANFGDSMLLGLSGGYDSRLLLAAALKAGVRPRLFVGGDAASADVRIAKAVAAGFDLSLEHLDTAALPEPAAHRFPAIVDEKLAYYDGAGIRGAINDGEEYLWRLRRMAGQSLELNGGGGEIYRDFWKIPNRRIPIRDFVVKVFEFKNLDKIAAATPRFDRAGYRESLAGKLKSSLRTSSDAMSREQVASLYTILRSTCFAGPSNKEMNVLAYGLLPFAEPKLAFPSYRIPLRYRIYGRFESQMIRRLNPALASYPSSYGHRFCDPLPLAKRARETVDRHCRNLVPLPLIFVAYRMLRKKNQYNSSPYYYSERYLRTVLDPKKLRIAEYFDPEKLRALDDPFVYSRALTVELLLTPSRDAAALPRAA
jgi:hypothetical protein